MTLDQLQAHLDEVGGTTIGQHSGRNMFIAMCIVGSLPTMTIKTPTNFSNLWELQLLPIAETSIRNMSTRFVFSKLEVLELVRRLHQWRTMSAGCNYVMFYELVHGYYIDKHRPTDDQEMNTMRILIWDLFVSCAFDNRSSARIQELFLTKCSGPKVNDYRSFMYEYISQRYEESDMPQNSGFRREALKLIDEIIGIQMTVIRTICAWESSVGAIGRFTYGKCFEDVFAETNPKKINEFLDYWS